MILLLWAFLVMAPQTPGATLAGHWRLESYARERLVGERDGRPVTATESLGATQELDVTVAGNRVTISMSVTDPRTRGIGATDRYEVDGQYHEYEWGDTVPRSIGSRTAVWEPQGFAIMESPQRDSPARQVRYSVSEDGRRLTNTIVYPPSTQPIWTRPPVRDLLVFVREP